ncbi:tetratricopeptide repeat protein [Olleya sp. HaHaR_3_96]|uniref:tetratricopeptide repeat protein n=1 Tax=Olleya sp. HaHaR_3_96 TaxID=2745560 RepID=UPI001C4F27CD|nr:tetratricopeptide repeat protein [Olleya sp. HaHaR_3_96]QXP58556.1 tetratricopeptide repeat protein [Olleya sp. HaHaR_3_96]
MKNIERAIHYKSEGDWKKAITYYEKAAIDDPNNADLFKDLGLCARNAKAHEKSFESYKKGYELAPSRPVFPYRMASALIELKRFEEAIAACDLALQINNEYTYALEQKAVIYHFHLKQSETAYQIYKAVVRVEKMQTYGTYFNFGQVCYILGKKKDALDAFSKAHKAAPKNPRPLKNIAIKFIDFKPKAVLEAAKKWLLLVADDEAEKENAEVTICKALIALEAFEDAIVLAEKHKLLFSDIAMKALSLKKDKMALPMLLKAIEYNTQEFLIVALIQLYIRLDQVDTARLCFDTNKEMMGGDPDFDRMSGMIRKAEMALINGTNISTTEIEWLTEMDRFIAGVFANQTNEKLVGGVSIEFNNDDEASGYQIQVTAHGYSNKATARKLFKTYHPETEHTIGSYFFQDDVLIPDEFAFIRLSKAIIEKLAQTTELKKNVFVNLQEHDHSVRYFYEHKS